VGQNDAGLPDGRKSATDTGTDDVAAEPPLCPNGGPLSRDLTADKAMPSGANFKTASFRLWYPKGLDRARGILVLTTGVDGDGRGMVEDPVWQQFAVRNKVALLGCYFAGGNYAQAGLGSGQAMLDAITALSQTTGRCELANAPLLLWGFSAGGQYNWGFACFAPERVIAFIVNKGGYYHPTVPPPATNHVPALMFIGGSDKQYRIDDIKRIFTAGRSAGAPFALAIEPGVHHEFGSSVTVSVPYFEGVLPLRLPPGSSGPLVDIDQSKGYIGDLKTHTIAPATTTQPTDLAHTVWLPDQATAEAWRNLH
jgi:predicted esterase